MPRITVDFSDVQDFEVLAKGEYPIIVDKVEMRDSQTSDYPYLNWQLKISEGDHKDRLLWIITSFSPKALFRLKDVLENLGVFAEELDIEVDEETNIVTKPELIGLPGIAVVSQRVYEGKPQNQVDTILGVSGAAKSTGKGAAPQKKAPSRPRAAK